MKKNDLVIGSAEALGTSGEGIVHVDGITLFVPFLLPGERAQIKILQMKGKIAYGKVIELFTPAEERVRPKCPVFFKCGGCQLQHLKYRFQLKFKTKLVEDALSKIAGISVSVSPCENSEKEYGYRNKLQLPIGFQNGKNVIGFYAERSHHIIETPVCPIHPVWSEKVISALYAFMDETGVNGYNVETGEGVLKRITVREIKRKFLITLTTAVRDFPQLPALLKKFNAIFKEYSFFLSFQPENVNSAFGEEVRLVKGDGVYSSEEGGILFEAGARTFLQVNNSVREKLYEFALSLVDEGETVVDCYSGGGLLTAMFAQKCKKAYGIEIVPEANACADQLREKNNLSQKMQNLLGSVELRLPEILEKEKDVTLVLDPPRAGLERSVIQTIKKSNPKKIVMISCNPSTLARDLGLLTGSLLPDEKGVLCKTGACKDYNVELVRPFDMFPQTKHVETVVLLTKNEL